MSKEKLSAANRRSGASWGASGADFDQMSASIADAILHAVKKLSSHGKIKVLDVGCGTGWGTRELAKQNPEAKVYGMDISDNLIRAATLFADAYQLPIQFTVAEAERLPFQSASFDEVISTFGLVFSNDPESCARELGRVCRPGGQLVFTAWKRTSRSLELQGALQGSSAVSKSAPEEINTLWSRRDFVQDLLGSNFKLNFQSGRSLLFAPGAEWIWNLWASTGLKGMLANKTEAERVKSRKQTLRFLRQFKMGKGICFPRDYVMISGTRRE